MANNGCQTRENQPNHSQCQVKKIDVLPDDVLLEVFGFYMEMRGKHDKRSVEGWQSLVHVCRRWRSLVFQSPRRLDLQLYCTEETSMDTLDAWPALPLAVKSYMLRSSDTDNIITALGQNSRICQLNLRGLTGWQLDNVLAAMQVPFPELTEMRLSSDDGKTRPVIPDSFLGGFAPRLRVFEMNGIPFPGLPKLLLSAKHLTCLYYYNIPHSGYTSPEEMVSLISELSNLEALFLEFLSRRSRPSRESRSLPPQKRSILPVLKRLFFNGITEYLEELVSRIDSPQLRQMRLTFLNQVDIDCPRLVQFINGIPGLTRALDKAGVHVNDCTVCFVLQHGYTNEDLQISISCREPDRQLSSIEQICNSSLHPFSTVEALYIKRDSQLLWMKDAIETTQWLQLFRPFTAVKNLYIFKEFAPSIMASLQEHVGGGITEVLPSLQNIFVQGLRPLGSFQDSVGQFVNARQLSGRLITISLWDIQTLTSQWEDPSQWNTWLSSLLSQ